MGVKGVIGVTRERGVITDSGVNGDRMLRGVGGVIGV